MISLLILVDVVGQKATNLGDRALSAEWPVVLFAGMAAGAALLALGMEIARAIS